MKKIKAPTVQELSDALCVAIGAVGLLEAYLNGSRLSAQEIISLCADIRDLEFHVIGGTLHSRREQLDYLIDYESPMVEVED